MFCCYTPAQVSKKREPWQTGLVFLICQFFTWKIKLQTQLSYRSEVTQPLIQGGSGGITFQGTWVSGWFVTLGTGCVMCAQTHTPPGCSNRDNPAPPLTMAPCACHLCHTTDQPLIPQEGSSTAKTAGNLCYQQRNHIFPAGIAAVGAGCPAGMSVSMPTSGSHAHGDAHVPNPCQEGAQGCWNPEGLIVWITAANSIISLHPGWRPHCQCEKGHLSDLSGLKRRISPKSSMKGCSRKSSSHC